MARRAGGAGSCGAAGFAGAASFFGASFFCWGCGLACFGCPSPLCACGLPSLSCPLASLSRSLAMLSVHLLAVRLEHAHLAAVFERLHARPVGLLRRGVEQSDVGDMDRQVLVDDAAGLALHRIGPLVLLDAVH